MNDKKILGKIDIDHEPMTKSELDLLEFELMNSELFHGGSRINKLLEIFKHPHVTLYVTETEVDD